ASQMLERENPRKESLDPIIKQLLSWSKIILLAKGNPKKESLDPIIKQLLSWTGIIFLANEIHRISLSSNIFQYTKSKIQDSLLSEIVGLAIKDAFELFAKFKSNLQSQLVSVVTILESIGGDLAYLIPLCSVLKTRLGMSNKLSLETAIELDAHLKAD